MAPMSAEELEGKLLSDPDCPWSRIFRDPEERGMSVRTLRKFAERRGHDPDDVEAAMNEYVDGHGGKRQQVINLREALPNLVRRMTGKPEDVHELWRIPKATKADS